MSRSKHYFIRKTHRYLGLILGIQFLMWTIGGLYFSWSNIDEIHGDFERRKLPLFSSDIRLISPASVMDTIKKVHRVDSLVSVQLIDILGNPFYQVRCVQAPEGYRNHHEEMNHLADARTGVLRGPLSEAESVELAKRHFNGEPVVKKVEYLHHTNTHHEYRGSPLPAYAIRFEHPSETTVYVASELGTVQKFRNDKWRIFDFLWMMHTMDYQSRDDFGNLLLRVFSVFGLVTILSGFVLFGVSSRRLKRLLRGEQPTAPPQRT